MVSGLPLSVPIRSLSVFARLGNLAQLKQYYYPNIDKIDEDEYIRAVYTAIDTRRAVILRFLIDQRYKIFIFVRIWMDQEYEIIQEAYTRDMIHILDGHVLMIPRDKSLIQPYHNRWYYLIGDYGKALLMFFLAQGLFIDDIRLSMIMDRAAHHGNIPLIAYLIQLGARPDACFSNALVTAGINSEWTTVRYLAAHGANIHAQGDVVRRSALYAALETPDDEELNRVLVLLGTNNTNCIPRGFQGCQTRIM